MDPIRESTVQKPHIILRILYVVVTIVLMLLAFLFLTVMNVSNILRTSLSEKTVSQVSDALVINSKDTTVDEWIYLYFYEHYDESYLEDFHVTYETCAAVLDSTDFTAVIKAKLMDYTQDLLYDTGAGTFTSEEMMDFVEANVTELYEATGYYYAPEVVEVLREYFLSLDMFDDLTLDALCDRIGLPLVTFRALINIRTAILCCVLFTVTVLLLMFLNRKKIYRAFLCSGIVCLINGICIVVFRFFFSGISLKFANRIGIGASLINSLEHPITSIMNSNGILWCAIGFIFMLAAYLSRSILPPRTRKTM